MPCLDGRYCRCYLSCCRKSVVFFFVYYTFSALFRIVRKKCSFRQSFTTLFLQHYMRGRELRTFHAHALPTPRRPLLSYSFPQNHPRKSNIISGGKKLSDKMCKKHSLIRLIGEISKNLRKGRTPLDGK